MNPSTAGFFLDEDEALALIRTRIRLGLPSGARDIRALGYSLCTDRYHALRRRALQDLGLNDFARPAATAAATIRAAGASGPPPVAAITADMTEKDGTLHPGAALLSAASRSVAARRLLSTLRAVIGRALQAGRRRFGSAS